MNNIPNASIGISPNEILYGMKMNLGPFAQVDGAYEDIKLLCLWFQQEANDATAITQIVMKEHYNTAHKKIDMNLGNKVFLHLHKGYMLASLCNWKLSN